MVLEANRKRDEKSQEVPMWYVYEGNDQVVCDDCAKEYSLIDEYWFAHASGYYPDAEDACTCCGRPA